MSFGFGWLVRKAVSPPPSAGGVTVAVALCIGLAVAVGVFAQDNNFSTIGIALSVAHVLAVLAGAFARHRRLQYA